MSAGDFFDAERRLIALARKIRNEDDDDILGITIKVRRREGRWFEGSFTRDTPTGEDK